MNANRGPIDSLRDVHARDASTIRQASFVRQASFIQQASFAKQVCIIRQALFIQQASKKHILRNLATQRGREVSFQKYRRNAAEVRSKPNIINDPLSIIHN